MNTLINRESLWGQIKSYIQIILGCLVYTFSWSAFLLPHGLAGGGVAGLAAVIHYGTGLPTGIFVILLNAGLVMTAKKQIGMKFAVNSIFGICCISLGFTLFEGMFKEPLVEDKFMCTIIAGALSAFGSGTTFLAGGNTGGTDIVALLVSSKRNISPGKVILICDLIIIATSYIVFQSIEKIVFGYVIMCVFSYTIDLVLDGQKQSYEIKVFSKNFNEIARRVSSETGRGVTIIDGFGFYSQKEVKMLLILAHKTDQNIILKIIKETDEKAFVSVAKVSSVFGENFDKIKVKK